MSCLFCRIIAGEIPCEKVFETPDILAFKDLYPKAPFHVLVIPKRHIATLNDLNDAALNFKLLQAVQTVAQQAGFADYGYQLKIHCNAGGGQEVFHLHYHLLSQLTQQ